MSLGGGFKYLLYVHLHLGKISILILTSIFFNWGFNHHLGQRVFKPFFPTWPPTFSGHQKKKLRHPSKTAHSDFRVGPKVGIQREIHPKAPLNSGGWSFMPSSICWVVVEMKHAKVACKGVEDFQNGLNHVYHIYISWGCRDVHICMCQKISIVFNLLFSDVIRETCYVMDVYIYIVARLSVGKLLLRCDPTCSSQSMVHVLSEVAGYVECNGELVVSILAFFLHHTYIQPLIYDKSCPGSRRKKTYNMSFLCVFVDIYKSFRKHNDGFWKDIFYLNSSLAWVMFRILPWASP